MSYASKDTCVLIRRDAPLITNVSVETTNPSTGTIYIRWTKPLPGILGIDTITYPPPYSYVLRKAVGMISTKFFKVDSISSTIFDCKDTTFIDTAPNTQFQSYNYRVDLYSGKTFVASSATASSIYLTAKPSQNSVK